MYHCVLIDVLWEYLDVSSTCQMGTITRKLNTRTKSGIESVSHNKSNKYMPHKGSYEQTVLQEGHIDQCFQTLKHHEHHNNFLKISFKVDRIPSHHLSITMITATIYVNLLQPLRNCR